MRLTRASDYAVRVLVHLTSHAESARATREEIMANTGVPAAFLNKIIQKLVHSGLVVARPGVNGGCSLAVPPQSISALRVIEAIDGPVRLSECLGEPSVCERSGTCAFRSLLFRLERQIIHILSGSAITDLAHRDGAGIACIPIMSPGCGYRVK